MQGEIVVISYEISGAVACVSMDFPGANALNLTALRALYRMLKEIEKQKSVRVVLLLSKNKQVFSSGLDLKSFGDDPQKRRRRIVQAVYRVRRIVRAILASQKTYVAAISGAVIGSAVSVALACDFRIVDSRAWFWLPDPQYGGLLADGGLDLMRSMCGASRAKMLCMTNSRIGVDEVARCGLIHRVAEEKVLHKDARTFADSLAQLAQSTLRETKSLIDKGVLRRFPLLRLIRVVYARDMPGRLEKYRHIRR